MLLYVAEEKNPLSVLTGCVFHPQMLQEIKVLTVAATQKNMEKTNEWQHVTAIFSSEANDLVIDKKSPRGGPLFNSFWWSVQSEADPS